MINYQHLAEIKLLSTIFENCPEAMNKIGEKDSFVNPEFLTPILFPRNIRPVKEDLIEKEGSEDYKEHFLDTMKKNDISPETSIMIGFNIHFRHNGYDSTALVTKVQEFLSSKGIKSAVIPPVENHPLPVLSLDLAQEGLLAKLQAIYKDMSKQGISK